MAKRKAGLHKNVSSIFDGVPVPGKNGTKQPQYAPTSDSTSDAPANSSLELLLKADSETESSEISQESQEYVPEASPAIDVRPQESIPEPMPQKEAKPKVKIQVETASPLQQFIGKVKTRLFDSQGVQSQPKQKMMAVLVPVLALVMVFMLMRAFKTPENAGASVTVENTEQVQTASVSVQEIWQVPQVYPADLRDPMNAASVKATVNGTPHAALLTVSGILYSEDKASAVIQGQIVYEGDTMLGATLVKINKKSVEFEKDGKTWTQKVQR